MKKLHLVMILFALTLCSCVSNGVGANSNAAQGDGDKQSQAESMKHTVRFILDGEAVKTLSVKDGAKMSAPSSTEFAGYIVQYWYVKEGGMEVPWTFSGGTVTSDLDLYASFQYETYAVKLVSAYGGDAHETSVSYKQAYDFSSHYEHKADHLENESGASFAVSGTWNLTHGETLTPVFKASQVIYKYYELSSAIKDDCVSTFAEQIQGVNNPNPVNLAGKPDDLDVALKPASKEGYRFEGWYRLAETGTTNLDNNLNWSLSKLDNVCDGYFGTEICGLFSKLYSVSLTSSDETRGKAEFVGGKVSSAYVGDAFTIKASPSGDYVFGGWHDRNGLISRANPYTFTMPAEEYSLSAVFWNREQSLGIDPAIDSASGTLTYGLYPQSHVSDEDTIESLNALTSARSDGWYLLNGEYFAKESAELRDWDHFDDGTVIGIGATYWFKCEPITWKILSSSSGEYSLVSSALLDAHCYDDHYNNNYANSGIRKWLNGDFYNSAFSLGDSLIQNTVVDNSAATTDSRSADYACSDTWDKVYLLSYQDYINTEYFADAETRKCKTTDWARANGADCVRDCSGDYWTRSPMSIPDCAWFVSNDGDLDFYFSVDNAGGSVRPALCIKVAQ